MSSHKTIQKGHMTLPVETGQDAFIADLIERWQADALRDSDGSAIPESLTRLNTDIYSTLCLVRADQDYADAHPEFLHRKYLMSFPQTDFSDSLVIEPLNGYSRAKYELDPDSDPKRWWEVRDRTARTILPPDKWAFDRATGTVTIPEPEPYHEYTVSFLARQIWDSVSMYNHLTNGWTGRHIKSLDPYHPECRRHLVQWFEQWLAKHPQTDVVRFTTFAFNFVIDSDADNNDLYRDWLGYGETVSPLALEDFEKQYGYALTPEDFVDTGEYNATYKVPTKRYRDWMEFIHVFVIDFSRELVSLAHRAGKRTAMFQGDHWIGTEPYSEGYQRSGIDLNVGAVEDGVALRRLADSPGSMAREARFYPYFFPDVFREGNDPVRGSLENWLKIRRALMRRPIDRIGYGGYPSLTKAFPDFIEHVACISREFRQLQEWSGMMPALTHGKKVLILNAWGTWRSWLQNPVRDQRFHIPSRPDVMEFAGSNPLECLAGLPFDIEFTDFDSIARNGLNHEETGVIINMGDANTAWSGGQHWQRPEVVKAVRAFVADGGGFLGIGEPTACSTGNGRFFQLGDVLGVEKETGRTMGRVGRSLEIDTAHPLLSLLPAEPDFGNPSYVYPLNTVVSVLAALRQHIALAVNEYGHGRAAYLGNLTFSMENALLLRHLLLWLMGLSPDKTPWISHCADVDCAYYPATANLVASNAGPYEQTVNILTPNGTYKTMYLKPYQMQAHCFIRMPHE